LKNIDFSDLKRARLHRQGEGLDPGEGQGRDVDLLRVGQKNIEELEVWKDRQPPRKQQSG